MIQPTLLGHKTFPLPTSTPSVGPVPTVVPGTEPIFQEIGTTGQRTLWVVVVLMALSSLVFYVLTARAPLPKRTFHTLVSLSTTISFFVYLALATGEGITWKRDRIHESHKHVPDTHEYYFRQVFWLRYVNWFLTGPLALLSLTLLSGLPGAYFVVAVAADWAMLGTGLLGTFAGHKNVRWVWFALSCISYMVLAHHIILHGQRAANNKDVQTKRFYGSMASVSLLVKVLYPIALAAGALDLKISLDTETVLFAILDIFAQGLLGYWLLLAHDSHTDITLYVDGFWAHGIGNEGAIRIEEEGP
ncbi:hypothetical protein ASPZODRAFT_88482 [Penicilliopsis zonata CBS 506.65]|uniref:Opsin n=1 Tax=Penicilliopsis zonata CBS 506.65 TaxID=1073090 RepID=A0A1L9SX69_9EURO|nr:hypothetical protein ASPZODRAFT_88482 [Penicilliopsis zonata CBS 506.65]OJJ51756.1 hypothetical protein ASPZODRAFT_88482 [Penicilliopsis zonata CBS 506.65]